MNYLAGENLNHSDSISSFNDPTRQTRSNRHICMVYEKPEERREMIFSFLTAGLEYNEKCLWVINKHNATDVLTLPEKLINNKRSDQFTWMFGQDVFRNDSLFDPYQAILFNLQQIRQAYKEGYSSLRLVCDMNWILQQDPHLELLMDYEEKLNAYFYSKYNCTILCVYDFRAIKHQHIRMVITTYPFIMHHNQIVHNPLYIPYWGKRKAGIHMRGLLETIERHKKINSLLQ